MTVVIADTSPLNYLILIGEVRILAGLYGEIIIPSPVWEELRDPGAPELVRRWVDPLPGWVKVKDARLLSTYGNALGRGETSAISLASELTGSMVLIDDRAARSVAAQNNLAFTGTIGILERAAEKGLLIDVRNAFHRLLQTNFRVEPGTVANVLERIAQKKSK
jgi:predicted nucleic acid-binding protein